MPAADQCAGAGSNLNDSTPAASSAEMVSITATYGSMPCAEASEAASPVSHCISATPRNSAMVNTAMARPVMAAG